MVVAHAPDLTPAETFISEFHRRTGAFRLRLATAADAPFLRRLFLATEGEATALPTALLEMQHESQRLTYAALFPAAMDVVVERHGRPVGRMMIDWTAPDGFYGVDLAVLPGERSGAAGLHLLHAWIGTADRFDRPATLRVRPGAPVIPLYQRLGFTLVGEAEVPLRMLRPPALQGASGVRHNT